MRGVGMRAGMCRLTLLVRSRARRFTVAIGGGTFGRVQILVHAVDGRPRRLGIPEVSAESDREMLGASCECPHPRICRVWRRNAALWFLTG